MSKEVEMSEARIKEIVYDAMNEDIKIRNVALMNNTTAHVLLMLLAYKKVDKDLKEGLEEMWLCKVIKKRVEVIFNYELEDRLLLFLTVLCETPGVAVMYLWYIHFYAKEKLKKVVTLKEFVEVFGDGFIKEESLNDIWDNQKVKMNLDNMLDHIILKDKK